MRFGWALAARIYFRDLIEHFVQYFFASIALGILVLKLCPKVHDGLTVWTLFLLMPIIIGGCKAWWRYKALTRDRHTVENSSLKGTIMNWPLALKRAGVVLGIIWTIAWYIGAVVFAADPIEPRFYIFIVGGGLVIWGSFGGLAWIVRGLYTR